MAVRHVLPQSSTCTFTVGILVGCLVSTCWRESSFLDTRVGEWVGVFGAQGSLLTSQLRLGEWVTAGTSDQNLTELYKRAEDVARLRKTAVDVASLRLELLKELRANPSLGLGGQSLGNAAPCKNSSSAAQGDQHLRKDSLLSPAQLTNQEPAASAATELDSGGTLSLAGSLCNTTQFQHLAGGFIVEGPCVCLAGALCSLSIQSNNASHWETNVKLAQELIVYFVGPSRGIADLAVEHYSGSFAAWTATFRLWDAGEYRALIQTGCTGQGLFETLADFTLTVVANQSPGALTPCSYGQGYRWLRNTAGGYEWTNYACAPPIVPAADYALLLRRKGFRRVIFVGDSQQRALFQHLKFLLGAPIREEELTKPKHDMSEVINAGDPERELHLLFYWIDGIYQNGEFGCINRGMFSGRNETTSFPAIATGADVISLEAGTWTAAWCADAWKSFNKHLPEYLDWGETLLTPQSRLVWRTAPSYITQCRRKHVKLQYVNRVALENISPRPYQPFSSWDVEAPRFADYEQEHYSWATVDPATSTGFAMAGPVGEAVARAFMTWTIYTLR